MNVIELQTEDNNKNLNYIENGIKSYIKNNHYPRKLVLNNINSDILKRKELFKKLNDKTSQIENEMIKFNNMIDELKINNTKKINSLLSTFASNIF